MSDSLYVRIRRVGPNEPKPSNYTIGGTNFEYNHDGWYKVSTVFGEGLRNKRSNVLNPNSPPVFEVFTHEQVINLEQSEAMAKRLALQRQQRQATGERVSAAIPKDAMVDTKRVGRLSESPIVEPEKVLVAEPVVTAPEPEPVAPSSSDNWDDSAEAPAPALEEKPEVIDSGKRADGPSLVKVPEPAVRRSGKTLRAEKRR